jgi:dihydrofolate reductase
MAKVIYATPTSLDGCIEDETGKFDWATPDEEGFALINDLERPIGMYLYGRKMYETMAIWGTPDVIPPDVIPGGTPAMLDFARTWQAADKIVYSKSLETVSTPKTRLEREFDAQAIRDLKAQFPQDVSVGGPALAAHAIRTGLVGEIHLFVVPMVIGGGKQVLPSNIRVRALAQG